MIFTPAGELLGPGSTVRTLRLAHHPQLPDGEYTLVDAYGTDRSCECRKTRIHVLLDGQHVSTVHYGWESPAFYQRWYGAPLDAITLAEMKGPSIDLNSPDRVPRDAMLAFFIRLLDARYAEHLRQQYAGVRAALAAPAQGSPPLSGPPGRAGHLTRVVRELGKQRKSKRRSALR